MRGGPRRARSGSRSEARVTGLAHDGPYTRDEVLSQLTANRRWQTGMAVTVGISLVVTLLNWLKII